MHHERRHHLRAATGALAIIAAMASPAAADSDTTDIEIELQSPPSELSPPPPPGPQEPKPEPASIAIEIGAARDSERPPRDDAEPAATAEHDGDDDRLLHGFRLGYLFLFNHDVPVDPSDPNSSLEREHGLRSPHQFLIGYEVANRVTGSGWLNILLVGNAMISGLEQSKLFPSANLLLGFEFDRSFQTGVGVNLVPVHEKPAHMVVAAGWTPRMGEMYLPVHFFFIPDVDDNHRMGITVGVNWST